MKFFNKLKLSLGKKTKEYEWYCTSCGHSDFYHVEGKLNKTAPCPKDCKTAPLDLREKK